MRKSFTLALAMAAATIGSVSAAQAQMGQQMGDHRADHPGSGLAQQELVPRDQSLQLRSEIGDLSNQITRAHQDRRLSDGQFLGFQRDIKSLQGQYWGKMDQGMTRGEYGSVNGAIVRLRTQLDRIEQDHRAAPPGPGSMQPGMVSGDQSLQLRSVIGDLNNRITRAYGDRRLSRGQFLGFQREIKSLQGQFWGKMEQGMTRSEYGSVNDTIDRLRAQLERTVGQNSGRPH